MSTSAVWFLWLNAGDLRRFVGQTPWSARVPLDPPASIEASSRCRTLQAGPGGQADEAVRHTIIPHRSLGVHRRPANLNTPISTTTPPPYIPRPPPPAAQ